MQPCAGALALETGVRCPNVVASGPTRPLVASPAAATADSWGRRAVCGSAALAAAAAAAPANALFETEVKDWQGVNLPIISESAPILFDI
mgnify:CR=1 FL=1